VYAATPKKKYKNQKTKSWACLIAGSPLMRDKAARLIHMDTSLSQDTALSLLPHSASNPVTEWHLV